MHKVALVRSMHHQNRLHDSASTEALTGRQAPTGRSRGVRADQAGVSLATALAKLRAAQCRLTCRTRRCRSCFTTWLTFPAREADSSGRLMIRCRSRRPGERDLQRRSAGLAERDNRRNRCRIADACWLSLQEPSLSSATAPPIDVGNRRAKKLISCSNRNRYGRHSTFATRRRRHCASVMVLGPRRRQLAREVAGGNGAELAFLVVKCAVRICYCAALVEAGVPFVNVFDFRQQGQNWDAHFHNFEQHKTQLVAAGRSIISALIEDLDAHGFSTPRWWWRWASSVARRRSIKREGATTGPTATRCCLLAVACTAARLWRQRSSWRACHARSCHARGPGGHDLLAFWHRSDVRGSRPDRAPVEDRRRSANTRTVRVTRTCSP